jgi:hypothetical protein
MDTSSGDQGKIELNLGENAEGQFSNFVVITHTESEFVLDFAVVLPGMPNPRVISRLVLTPDHAKRLLGALSQNVGRFEAKFGEITIRNPGAPPAV